MTKTIEQHQHAIRNREAALTELNALSIKITEHQFNVHPTQLECPVCRPWHLQEKALVGRVESLQKLIDEPISRR